MYQWKYTVLDPEYFLIVFETLRGCSFSKFPHSLIFIRRLFIRKTIFRDVDSDVRGVYEPHRTRSVDTKAEYPHKRLILNIFVRLFGVLRVVYSPLLGSFSFCEIDGQERLLGWTLLSPFAWVDQRHRKNRPQSVETVMQPPPPHTLFRFFFHWRPIHKRTGVQHGHFRLEANAFTPFHSDRRSFWSRREFRTDETDRQFLFAESDFQARLEKRPWKFLNALSYESRRIWGGGFLVPPLPSPLYEIGRQKSPPRRRRDINGDVIARDIRTRFSVVDVSFANVGTLADFYLQSILVDF